MGRKKRLAARGKTARNKDTGTTEKEEAFCRMMTDPEFTGDVYEAYALAGYSQKGSTSNVQSKARTLATKDNVVLRIATLKAQQVSEDPELEPSDQLVLARLQEEIDADLADILNEDGTIRPVRTWPKVWRRGLVSSLKINQKRVKGKLMGEIVELRIATDKTFKRLELQGKFHQLWSENHNVHHTGEVTVRGIQHEYVNPPQLDEHGNFRFEDLEHTAEEIQH